MVFLERKTGIAGVTFGRTEVSVPFFVCRCLSHRHGPEGPGVQGMPEKFDFHVSLICF